MTDRAIGVHVGCGTITVASAGQGVVSVCPMITRRANGIEATSKTVRSAVRRREREFELLDCSEVLPEDSVDWVDSIGSRVALCMTAEQSWAPREIATGVWRELRRQLNGVLVETSASPSDDIPFVLSVPSAQAMSSRLQNVWLTSARQAGFRGAVVLPSYRTVLARWHRELAELIGRGVLTVEIGQTELTLALHRVQSEWSTELCAAPQRFPGLGVRAVKSVLQRVLRETPRLAPTDAEFLKLSAHDLPLDQSLPMAVEHVFSQLVSQGRCHVARRDKSGQARIHVGALRTNVSILPPELTLEELTEEFEAEQQELLDAIDELCQCAEIEALDLGGICCAGGGFRLGLVPHVLRQLGVPLWIDPEPEQTNAVGAAHYAARDAGGLKTKQSPKTTVEPSPSRRQRLRKVVAHEALNDECVENALRFNALFATHCRASCSGGSIPQLEVLADLPQIDSGHDSASDKAHLQECVQHAVDCLTTFELSDYESETQGNVTAAIKRVAEIVNALATRTFGATPKTFKGGRLYVFGDGDEVQVYRRSHSVMLESRYDRSVRDHAALLRLNDSSGGLRIGMRTSDCVVAQLDLLPSATDRIVAERLESLLMGFKALVAHLQLTAICQPELLIE